MDSHFQVSPEIFYWVQSKALAGPLKDIHRVVPKPLLPCLGCVLRVIVLLEGEPSSQTQVLGQVLWARSPLRISLYLRPNILVFIRPDNLVSHSLRVI